MLFLPPAPTPTPNPNTTKLEQPLTKNIEEYVRKKIAMNITDVTLNDLGISLGEVLKIDRVTNNIDSVILWYVCNRTTHDTLSDNSYMITQSLNTFNLYHRTVHVYMMNISIKVLGN